MADLARILIPFSPALWCPRSSAWCGHIRIVTDAEPVEFCII